VCVCVLSDLLCAVFCMKVVHNAHTSTRELFLNLLVSVGLGLVSLGDLAKV